MEVLWYTDIDGSYHLTIKNEEGSIIFSESGYPTIHSVLRRAEEIINN